MAAAQECKLLCKLTIHIPIINFQKNTVEIFKLHQKILELFLEHVTSSKYFTEKIYLYLS